MGPDGMHPKSLFETRRIIATPLTIIFNKSIQEGKIPLDWKNANVVAIHKKGDKRIAGNYRPVSLTSVVCKTMEKLVRMRIMDHMASNQLFSRQQFGFLPGRSTLLQLLLALEEWMDMLEKGYEVDVIYMDFCKAFDKVTHSRLIDVLRHYGLHRKVLNWVKDFLHNRKQRVCLAGVSSGWEHVASGVPQGSVLGPILFVMYINTLPNVVKNASILLFADDAKVYKGVRNQADQRDLQ
jgi:hypothetical protein